MWHMQGGPCGEAACNVCSICMNGFKILGNVGSTARRTGFDLRYGQGLYFSSVAGKANDYAVSSEKVNRSSVRHESVSPRCSTLARWR